MIFLYVKISVILNTSLYQSLWNLLHPLPEFILEYLSFWKGTLFFVPFFLSHIQSWTSRNKNSTCAQFTVLNFKVTSNTSQVSSDWRRHPSHSNQQKQDRVVGLIGVSKPHITSCSREKHTSLHYLSLHGISHPAYWYRSANTSCLQNILQLLFP